MSILGKVFLFRARGCECCGEKVVAPRLAGLLFGPIGVLISLKGLGMLYGGRVVSDFALLCLLASAYFVYIVWVPLVPKEEPLDSWADRFRWLLQGLLMFAGSAFIALPLWFLLTFDFHRRGPLSDFEEQEQTTRAKLLSHRDTVTSLTWSPDGKTLASGSLDRRIKFWHASNGELLRTVDNTAAVSSVAWSPDGKILAAGSNNSPGHPIKFWDASNGKLLRDIDDDTSVTCVAWSPDGRMLATGGYGDTVKLWDASNGTLLQTLRGDSDRVVSLAWSPDGKMLASVSDAISNQDGIRLWDAGNGRLLRTLRVHERLAPGALAWSPDGKMLVSSWNGSLRMWDAASWRLLHTYPWDGVLLEWSPDGKMLAGNGAGDTVNLWNAANGQLVRTLTGHSWSVESIAWSPDGQTLASGSSDHTIKLWHVNDGRLLATLGFDSR
jgi:WD40 repeat protein